MSQNNSLAPTTTEGGDGSTFSSLSMLSSIVSSDNMDPGRIGAALQISAHQPSLFQPFSPSEPRQLQEQLHEQLQEQLQEESQELHQLFLQQQARQTPPEPAGCPLLPPPLLPSPVGAEAMVPELQARQPAPYSMANIASALQETEEQQQEVKEEVHCPWCNEAFPAGGPELDTHVDQHLAQVGWRTPAEEKAY